MNNSHLASSKEKLCAIVETTTGICTKYASRDEELAGAISKFRRVYDERIDDLNPSIMIYGIYNAGKSTLLNALVGKNIAEMNDVPTTVKVTPYRWNEFTIFDTPGINAPKKDEEVSKAQLEKSDVIIFVMDTEGQFNAAKNYREMVGVVNDRKRLLIVLNNKSGIDMQSEDGIRRLEVIKGGIYNDFATAFGSSLGAEELSRRFKIIIVDAKMALQAREEESLSAEDKQVLIDGSNIEALEDAIREEYSKASGYTVLGQIAQLLSKELASLGGLLRGLTSDEMSQKGFDAQDSLAKQQEGLTSKVTDYIYDHVAELKDEIFKIATSCKGETEARAALEEFVGILAKKINDYFAKEVRKISGRIDCTVGDFVKIALPERINVLDTIESAQGTIVLAQENNASTTRPNKREALIETAATYEVAKPLLKDGIKALTPIVTKIPVLGPIIGPTLPILGPILLAAAALKILFGGEDRKALEEQMAQQRAQMEAQIAQQEAAARQRQECIEESARMSRKIGQGFIDHYSEKITQLFDPMYAQIQEAMEKSKAETAAVMADLRVVKQSQCELDDLTRNWSV